MLSEIGNFNDWKINSIFLNNPILKVYLLKPRISTDILKHESVHFWEKAKIELHWLPIRMRIQFKILVYVYKCRYNLAPEYLSELVLPSTVTYATRSSFDTSLLHIPKTKTVTGDSAFHAAAPRLWNKLPRNIREAPSIHVFKSLLKTHLFWNCLFFAILDCSVYFILYLFLCLALCSL